ncbi:hypothetical protein EKO27_g3183 [Xylaria grammica]|uniref:Uncharacterized protein n=1 Tax=Xylaria grammica TaxID=363999 RepID=A0A439DC00_9PEZI|nr:hypothetical protein EKO27_g3183 [Xylaria grammica]
MRDAGFQNFVRLEDNGLTGVYSLPTGSRACRAFMQTLCMNQEEGVIAGYPSNNIMFQVARSDVLADVQAKLIRREGYFWAILVQSRGFVVPACRDGARGGCLSHSGAPFTSCRRVPGFQGGACGACVWRSHGARCSHRG